MINPVLIQAINPFIIASIISFGSLPFIFRNREPCYEDDDCPFIMKCCILGIEKYCCTPNNYIKYEYMYLYETVKNN